MSATHQSAMFIHACQLHASAVARLKAMIHINELRMAGNLTPIYDARAIREQADLVDAHIINPRDFE